MTGLMPSADGLIQLQQPKIQNFTRAMPILRDGVKRKGLNGRGCGRSCNHSDHFSFRRKRPWYLFSRVPGFNPFSEVRNFVSFLMGSPVYHRRMCAAKYFH